MPAGTNTDSDHALPLHGDGHSTDGEPSTATAPPAADPPPKARAKRPRPCFEDGTLTRVFKFPSKTYPRSSYYVTSTEIIIRIKKARRKWKLVVPKKRIVSYRTNRWFAKPRWVELELTFTQASRLGLIESRPHRDRSAEPQLAGGPVDGTSLADASASAPQPDLRSMCDTVLELDSEVDEPGPAAGDDELPSELDAPVVSFLDCEPGLPAPGSDEERLAQSLPLPAAAACSLPSAPVATDLSGRETPPSESNGYVLAAALALVLLGAAGAWLALGELAALRMADGYACAHPRPAASCTQTIVTGAIGTLDSLPESDARMLPEPPGSTELVAATGRAELSAPEMPEIAAQPSEPLADPPEDRTHATSEAEPAPQEDPAVEMDLAPAAATAADPVSRPPDPPADRHGCRELDASAGAIDITFDFASASLDRAILGPLEAFADRLRSCPSVTVIIEGHADSDGRADRNQALSARRAYAVREHLITAGARSEQISVVGLGQSRPTVPNVSAENKRRNRRAALVVEHPRTSAPERR